VLQVAEDEVEGDGGPCVSQMGIAVDCGSADVHANVGGMQGFETLFLSCQRVVDDEFRFHSVFPFFIIVSAYCFAFGLQSYEKTGEMQKESVLFFCISEL
jgi:hypothetical protein